MNSIKCNLILCVSLIYAPNGISGASSEQGSPGLAGAPSESSTSKDPCNSPKQPLVQSRNELDRALLSQRFYETFNAYQKLAFNSNTSKITIDNMQDVERKSRAMEESRTGKSLSSSEIGYVRTHDSSKTSSTSKPQQAQQSGGKPKSTSKSRKRTLPTLIDPNSLPITNTSSDTIAPGAPTTVSPVGFTFNSAFPTTNSNSLMFDDCI